MKRKTCMAVLAMCLILAAGCGNNGSGNADSTKTEDTKTDTAQDTDMNKSSQDSDTRLVSVDDIDKYITLGEYKGIVLTKSNVQVTDEDVDNRVTENLKDNMKEVTQKGATVQDGDAVTINFVGKKDGVAFEGGKAENHELEIGSNTFIAGFEDQIIGMKLEEEKDVKVKFPDDYFAKDLAGKDAVFKVKLHEIKKKELPKIDDEFAKDVSEFDTLSELKNSIKEKLDTENANKEKYETEQEAIKVVCDNTKIDIPNGMIELEIDNMMRDMETRLSYQGLKLSQYLQMMNKTEEDVRSNFKNQAEDSVKSRLVLEAIVKAENIEATPEEINDKLKELAKQYGRKEEELLENTQLNEYVSENIKTEKAIDFIVKNAKRK